MVCVHLLHINFECRVVIQYLGEHMAHKLQREDKVNIHCTHHTSHVQLLPMSIDLIRNLGEEKYLREI